MIYNSQQSPGELWIYFKDFKEVIQKYMDSNPAKVLVNRLEMKGIKVLKSWTLYELVREYAIAQKQSWVAYSWISRSGDSRVDEEMEIDGDNVKKEYIPDPFDETKLIEKKERVIHPAIVYAGQVCPVCREVDNNGLVINIYKNLECASCGTEFKYRKWRKKGKEAVVESVSSQEFKQLDMFEEVERCS